jgi:hypothetical protein
VPQNATALSETLYRVSIFARKGVDTRRRKMRTTQFTELLSNCQKAAIIFSNAAEYYTPPRDPYYTRYSKKRRKSSAGKLAELSVDENVIEEVEAEDNQKKLEGDMITVCFNDKPIIYNPDLFYYF